MINPEGTTKSQRARLEYVLCGAEMVLDVVLEVHRAVKTGADDLSDVGAGQKSAPSAQLDPPVRPEYLHRSQFPIQRRVVAESMLSRGVRGHDETVQCEGIGFSIPPLSAPVPALCTAEVEPCRV